MECIRVDIAQFWMNTYILMVGGRHAIIAQIIFIIGIEGSNSKARLESSSDKS